jgi:lipid-binding SYLF domain-containing protein
MCRIGMNRRKSESGTFYRLCSLRHRPAGLRGGKWNFQWLWNLLPRFQERKMKNKSSLFRSSGFAVAVVAMLGCGFSACTTTPPTQDNGASVDRHEINSTVDTALSRLYETVPSSRDLVRRAKGVVVFPSVLQAGFVVGGEYGKGSLRVGNVPEEYLRLTAGSVGWQIGAQSKAIIFLFMTQDALEAFRRSNGWEVGADATVALATIGANGDIDSNTVQKPIIGFVTTNAGLMAGVSLQGAKIDKIIR